MTEVTELCDWCGESFAPDETPVKGYENLPTHRKCQREAVRSWRRQMGSEFEPRWRDEPEPFTNWPNGQGVDD